MERANQQLDAQSTTAKRQIAFKVRIGHVLSGPYVKGEGWNPNYVSVGNLQVSRVNIIGVVLATNEDGTLLIDDGTGKITLRSFEQDRTFAVSVGDVVLVIGRPREFGSERYLLPEIVRKIDPAWAKVREHEIAESKIDEFTQATALQEPPVTEAADVDVVEETVMTDDASKPVDNPSDQLVARIRSLDDGTGAGFDALVADGENTEALLRKLLEEGDIFEIKPGKFKVLE